MSGDYLAVVWKTPLELPIRDNTDEPYRLRHYDRLMSRRASMVGLNVIDRWDLFPEALTRIGGWLGTGTLKHRTKLLDGLENALSALVRLYNGDHLGKLVVNVSDFDAGQA